MVARVVSVGPEMKNRKRWGMFLEYPEEFHVAPCDEEGFLKPPHVLKMQCPCQPRREGRNIVVHEQIQ